MVTKKYTFIYSIQHEPYSAMGDQMRFSKSEQVNGVDTSLHQRTSYFQALQDSTRALKALESMREIRGWFSASSRCCVVL
jgi:hypothetical protein